MSRAATEVQRQKFELARSGSATTGRSSLGHQCAIPPEPVKLAFLEGNTYEARQNGAGSSPAPSTISYLPKSCVAAPLSLLSLLWAW